MNSFTGAGAAFILLCVVVMVAIWVTIALIAFARRQWPIEKEVDKLQQYKLHQRLEEITNETAPAKKSA
jgi:hypothetical protein